MLYDLIKSHAALFFMQRQKKTSKDGTFCVYADESDFAVANEVFHSVTVQQEGRRRI